MNKARRVADRTSATGGQARDGLSAGLTCSGEMPKSDFCYSHPSQNVSLHFGRNQEDLYVGTGKQCFLRNFPGYHNNTDSNMERTAGTRKSITTFGFLRHGQTEWNTFKKIQGSGDSPLTPKGREETDQWVKTLEKYHWHHIIASDLGRVRETVAILNRRLQLPVLFDPRLREQNWGDWEGLTIPSIKENYQQELARRVAMGWDFSAPGGETRNSVKDRVLATLRESAAKWPGQKILVICHQGVIKSVLYFITNREFLPGEDPLLQHNRLHLISYAGMDFLPQELNIPRTP